MEVNQKQLRPLEELRHLLDESEKLAVNVRGAGSERAMALLQWFDRILELSDQLAIDEVNIQPELSRWEAVQGSVRRHGSELMRELAPAGGLAALRSELPEPPSPNRWWWWLDITSRKRRQKKVRNIVIAVAAIAVVAVVGYWLMNLLFPVDPIVQQTYRLRIEAEQAITDGDYDGAIRRMEEALALAPDQVEIQAVLKALYDSTGRGAEAEALLAQLLDSNQPDVAYAALAQAYVLLDDPEATLQAVDLALNYDQDNVASYMLAATAYERLGDFSNAIASLQQASDIADRLGDAELQAIARIRLGQLLQSAPMVPTQVDSAEP